MILDFICLLEDLGLEVKHGPINPEAWDGFSYWFRVKRPEPDAMPKYNHYMVKE